MKELAIKMIWFVMPLFFLECTGGRNTDIPISYQVGDQFKIQGSIGAKTILLQSDTVQSVVMWQWRVTNSPFSGKEVKSNIITEDQLKEWEKGRVWRRLTRQACQDN